MNALAVTVPADKTDVSMSVVVCAYTEARFALLVRCLDAVVEQQGPRDQLVVVIDYNDDLFHSIVDRYGDVALVTKNVNSRGLSGARNTGVKVAACDVVAFVDDDAQIQSGWAHRLREHYRDPSVAGIGGYANPVWPGSKPRWFPDEYHWVVGCSHRGLPTDVTPVRNFIGCNMSFRRSVFDNVGDFNVDMGRVGSRPVGCEETELCIRISQHDRVARLLFDPKLVVRHWVADDRVRYAYFLKRCFLEGLSKHRMSGIVGPADGLSSERHYVTRVLPTAFASGLCDAIFRRGSRRAACARTATIVVGLLTTTSGYAYSMLRSLGGVVA